MTTATTDGKAASLLSGNRIDLSHQEMDRLLHALEELYNDSKASTPELEWMPMTGVGNLLAQELGYEDMDEFEDAIGGSFQDFLRNFPHIELKEDARFTDGLVFKVHGDAPQSEWRPRRLAFRVAERKDLWRVCHKSKHGCIAIPHLEFEISADGNRVVDTLYNHISRAVFSLTSHAGPTGTDDLGAGVREKILENIEELNKLLDVEEPFEVVIIDPSGVSELKPDDGVTVTDYDPNAE